MNVYRKLLLTCVYLLMTYLSPAQGPHKIDGLDLFIAANFGATFVKFDSEVAEDISTGKKIDLANLSNKLLSEPDRPTLVIVWATPRFKNCPPCNRYKDALFNSKIDTAFNVVTIAVVNQQKQSEAQQEFMEKVKKDNRFYNLKIDESSGGPIAKSPVTPYTYVMNAQNQLIYKYEGYDDDIFAKLLHFKDQPLGYKYKYLKEGMFVNSLEESDEYIETEGINGGLKIKKHFSKNNALKSEKFLYRNEEHKLELLSYYEYDEEGKLVVDGRNMVNGKGYIFCREEKNGGFDFTTQSYNKYFEDCVYLIVDGETQQRAEVGSRINDSLMTYRYSGDKYGAINVNSHEITYSDEYNEIIPIGGDLFIVGIYLFKGSSTRPWKSSIIDKNKKEVIPYFYGRLKLIGNRVVKEIIEDLYLPRTYEILDTKGKYLGSYDNADALNKELSKIIKGG